MEIASKGADMKVDRYKRLVPVTQGTWERVARHVYEHVTGIVVRKCSRGWEIVGGAEDGYVYSTLSIAQHSALRHLTRKAA